jgi:hypothetical protein
MKSRWLAIIRIFALMLVFGLAAAAQNKGSKNPNQSDHKNPPPQGNKIELQCENDGSNQEVRKIPIITNNTSQAIKKGTRIFWTSYINTTTTVNDNGSRDLDEDLAPGATLKVMGKTAGNNYTCKAWYLPYAKILKK